MRKKESHTKHIYMLNPTLAPPYGFWQYFTKLHSQILAPPYGFLFISRGVGKNPLFEVPALMRS